MLPSYLTQLATTPQEVTTSRQSNSKERQSAESKSIWAILGEIPERGPEEHISTHPPHTALAPFRKYRGAMLLLGTPKPRAGHEFEPSPAAKDYVPAIANSPQGSHASPLDPDHVLQLPPQIRSKPAAERESSSRRLNQVPTETFRTFK